MEYTDVQCLLVVWPAIRSDALYQLECSPQVVELGPSCSGKIKKGDRVVAAPWTGAGKGDGTWQQYALVQEANLVRSPSSHFANRRA